MQEIKITNHPNIFIIIYNCIRRAILWEIYQHNNKTNDK